MPDETVPNIPRLFQLFNEKWNIYTHSNISTSSVHDARDAKLQKRAAQYMQEVSEDYDACMVINDGNKILAMSNGYILS